MNKTQSLLGLSLLLGVLMLSSCYYDNEEELYEYYNQQNQCDTSAVSFANDIMPMIQGNCVTGCHVAGGTGLGIFENYAEVKAKVDNGSMNNRVVVQRNMPPSGALTECQILQMRAWILNGAPNN
ncbi:MAG: hypothetical protein RL266_2258 [Bacteroidota bacterium]|jgi:hypothetical protein